MDYKDLLMKHTHLLNMDAPQYMFRKIPTHSSHDIFECQIVFNDQIHISSGSSLHIAEQRASERAYNYITNRIH